MDLSGRDLQCGDKKIIEDFLSFSNLNLPNKSILDVPCGAGYLGTVFSKFKTKVYASDISLEMMSLGKEEYSKKNFKDSYKQTLLSYHS